MPAKSKCRLDELLVARGLCPTRSQAQSLIMAGLVSVDNERQDKAGTRVSPDCIVHLSVPRKFVGRGFIKLKHALSVFNTEVAGKTCLDIGASTGGFTDCLLQNGAGKVYAVDVGYGQLHWKLATDPCVIRLDRRNFRTLNAKELGTDIMLAVMDVSFISIKKLVPKLIEIFSQTKEKKNFIVLVKPQFEVGKARVGKGGIVRDPKLHNEVVKDLQRFLQSSGFVDLLSTPSPITGTDGNREFFIGCTWC